MDFAPNISLLNVSIYDTEGVFFGLSSFRLTKVCKENTFAGVF